MPTLPEGGYVSGEEWLPEVQRKIDGHKARQTSCNQSVSVEIQVKLRDKDKGNDPEIQAAGCFKEAVRYDGRDIVGHDELGEESPGDQNKSAMNILFRWQFEISDLCEER